MLSDSGLHGLADDCCELHGSRAGSPNLLNEHRVFLPGRLDCESRATEFQTKRVTSRRADFYILCIMIEAVDDDEIFEATDDEQFTILDEAKIAGPQIRTGSVCRERLEDIIAARAPITAGDVGTLEPNLANVTIVASSPS